VIILDHISAPVTYVTTQDACKQDHALDDQPTRTEPPDWLFTARYCEVTIQLELLPLAGGS
jgi:hypothetical protein